MPVPAVSIPPTLLLIPEWKYGNLESHALRVTCQVPFTGLCYVTNICHRPSQTPHLRVKNANAGWRRGLVRHQLLNQSESERGGKMEVAQSLFARLAWTPRAEWCWGGDGARLGESHQGRAPRIPVQLRLLFATLGLQCVCVSATLRDDPWLWLRQPAFHYCKHREIQMAWRAGVSGHLVCVTGRRDRLTEPWLNSHSLSLWSKTAAACGPSPADEREPLQYTGSDNTSLSAQRADNRQQSGGGGTSEARFQPWFIEHCWGPVLYLLSMSHSLVLHATSPLHQIQLNISCLFFSRFPGSL